MISTKKLRNIWTKKYILVRLEILLSTYILANNTSTEAHIYKRNKENEFLQTNLIEPRGPAANGDVHLLKSGEYYEPIVPRSFIGLHK